LRLKTGETPMSFVDTPDWSKIPAPLDDGATRHLVGAKLASVLLRATDGSMIDLSVLSGRTVVYAYPRTGKPAVANPPGWDMIPGARGCTPQSCSFPSHACVRICSLPAAVVHQHFEITIETFLWLSRSFVDERLQSEN
jgi:hypothetical protein